MKNTRHATTNYRTLAPYIEGMDGRSSYRRFQSEGYMPLVFEFLHYNDYKGRPVFSIAHYTTQNGDAMRDPEMTFSVDQASGTIEPMTFQNDFMGMYQEVYRQNETGTWFYSQRLRIDLDEFLWTWLKNIKEQGYRLEERGQ